MSFEERAESMGLANLGGGCFHYADRYGEVVYRSLVTKGEMELLNNVEVPWLALFTKGPDPGEAFCHTGNILSDKYKFVGNDAINKQIRDSIQEYGSPVLTERTSLSFYKTQMYNEIIIQNASNIPQVGDVYPLLVVRNSYNGSMATRVEFGICMDETQEDFSHWTGFGFRTKLGIIKQIHVEKSPTNQFPIIGNYISSFNQNIVSIVEQNFNNLLTEDDMLRTLDLVENVGRRRRDKILNNLERAQGRVSSWNLFLAITRFSSIERNLNAKVLLENIAESVLVVPYQMTNVLEVLQDS